MRNVPKASDMEQENWDLKSAAMQDQEPLWKKVGRGAVDAVTSFVTDDPAFDEDFQNKSLGSKIGGIGNMLPLGLAAGSLKRLPIIAPEAYQHVKADGLRLYSRLTDAFAKAPKVMNPDKIRSVARQGASSEEISLRKLEEFLTGRNPMDKVAREDVMGHLEANPLELDVVRKGGGTKEIRPPANEHEALSQQLRQIEHELDTQYGNDWNLTTIEHPDRQRWNQVNDRLQREFGGSINEWEPNVDATKYDWLQTPGPKENYGETLINLPAPNAKANKLPIAEVDREHFINHGADFARREGMPEEQIRALQHDYDTRNGVFQSPHWDEPNNLVWTRHNERRLNPTASTPDTPGQSLYDTTDDPSYMVYKPPQDATASGGSKGMLTEEIQSDWGQQIRERGAKGDTYPPIDVHPGVDNFFASTDTGDTYYTIFGETEDAARQNMQRSIDEQRPPDMPFKDTYHELAIKADLLDAAERPDLDWYGIADADTVSAMEGHSSVRPGTELYYNQKHPSTLEKLLKPLGGDVVHANLPSNVSGKPALAGEKIVVPGPTGIAGSREVRPIRVGGENVATSLNSNFGQSEDLATSITNRIKDGGQIPGPGMWKANLTPELKALIKERGFPAMAALLALQESMKTRSNKQ